MNQCSSSMIPDLKTCMDITFLVKGRFVTEDGKLYAPITLTIKAKNGKITFLKCELREDDME